MPFQKSTMLTSRSICVVALLASAMLLNIGNDHAATSAIAQVKPGLLEQIAELERRILKLESNAVPVGAILSCSTPTVPSGYIVCDGREIERTKFPKLAEALSIWNRSDGATIRVPDLRGEFLRGADDMKTDRGARNVDKGRQIGSHQEDGFKKHKHYVMELYRVKGDMPQLWASENNGLVATYPYQKNQAVQVTQKPFYRDPLKVDADNRPIEERFMDCSTEGEAETRPKNSAVVFIIKADY